jgi:SAM-dependent methyltransferase
LRVESLERQIPERLDRLVLEQFTQSELADVILAELSSHERTRTQQASRLRDLEERTDQVALAASSQLTALESRVETRLAGLTGAVTRAIDRLDDAASREESWSERLDRIETRACTLESSLDSSAAHDQWAAAAERLAREHQAALEVLRGDLSGLVNNQREKLASAETQTAERLSAMECRLEAMSSTQAQIKQQTEIGIDGLRADLAGWLNERLHEMERSTNLARTREREIAEQRLAEFAGRFENRLESASATVKALGAQLAQHADLPAATREMTRNLDELRARLRARPYMSHDEFGTLNLREPMGYSSGQTGPPSGKSFMELFRGTEEFISRRQQVYLPFFRDRQRIVDLGCGRGEFLRLLSAAGYQPVGVDQKLLETLPPGARFVQADALAYLRDQPPDSIDAIFSAQFVEHLTTDRLMELLTLARSRLCPGGLFIAETVNPESIQALRVFHVDLTHKRPIFPQTLLQLCRETGFTRASIFYPEGGGFTQEHYDTVGEYAVVAYTSDSPTER